MMIPLKLQLQAALVAGAVLFGVGMCRQRDAEIRAKAVLSERLADADSALAVWRKHAAHDALRVDTVVKRVRVAIAAVPDTVRFAEKVRDTVWVKEYVERSEDAREACGLLVSNCQQLRISTDSLYRAAERKIALLEARPRGAWRSRLTWAATGAALGVYAWERAR